MFCYNNLYWYIRSTVLLRSQCICWEVFFPRKQNCFRRKTNCLIYPYKVVVEKHLMDIPSWRLARALWTRGLTRLLHLLPIVDIFVFFRMKTRRVGHVTILRCGKEQHTWTLMERWLASLTGETHDETVTLHMTTLWLSQCKYQVQVQVPVSLNFEK